MINLNVEEYCSNCPEFETHIEKYVCDDRCEGIRHYLEKGVKSHD